MYSHETNVINQAHLYSYHGSIILSVIEYHYCQFIFHYLSKVIKLNHPPSDHS